VVAIGGVTVDLVPDLLAAGAHGVAVVGAVHRAVDPGRAAAALVDALGGSRR
jgi:thiamine-phosphate pyrophosphorylase